MNRSMMRHGFILILLALLTGILVPSATLPGLALSAHTIGILGGTLLIAIAAVWEHFELAEKRKRLLSWSWLLATYGNWLGCVVGAILGAGRATPIASAGTITGPAGEMAVLVLLATSGVAALAAVGMALYGLRTR